MPVVAVADWRPCIATRHCRWRVVAAIVDVETRAPPIAVPVLAFRTQHIAFDRRIAAGLLIRAPRQARVAAAIVVVPVVIIGAAAAPVFAGELAIAIDDVVATLAGAQIKPATFVTPAAVAARRTQIPPVEGRAAAGLQIAALRRAATARGFRDAAERRNTVVHADAVQTVDVATHHLAIGTITPIGAHHEPRRTRTDEAASLNQRGKFATSDVMARERPRK